MHVIANPGTLDPASNPQAWLAQAHRETDPARRMRRALVDDTCVHASLLDEEEAAWLSQRVRGDDGAPLAAAFGLSLERRNEGAAFVVPDEAFRFPRELGPWAFPTSGTVGHAALLLVEYAGVNGITGEVPGAGWRALSHAEVLTALASFAAENAAGRGGWSAEYAEDINHLANAVETLLIAINAVRRSQVDGDGVVAVEDWWWFAPVSGRWALDGAGTTRTGRHRVVNVPEFTIARNRVDPRANS